MRRLLPLALLLAFSAFSASPAVAKVPKDFVGTQDEFLLPSDANYRTTNLSSMSSIGVGTVRHALLWSNIETSPGVYNFAAYDSLVGKISSHGIKQLATLFGPPKWRAKTPKRGTCQPTKFSDFGDYAARVAQRYGSNGTYWKENPGVPKNAITTWQIWNEPNLGIYWCGKPNAKQYVQLVKVARAALKKVDPKAEIVTAGLPESALGVPLLKYIDQMYKAGGGKAFDTLAIHPYSATIPELKKRLISVRKVMNTRGDRSGKLWVTELAWSDVGPGNKFRVGPAGQAKRITEAFKLIGAQRSKLNLRGVIYVYWRDLPPYPPNFRDFWGLHTGLVRQDGSFKKAFYAFKNAVSKLK
jgi:hypothetical protein